MHVCMDGCVCVCVRAYEHARVDSQATLLPWAWHGMGAEALFHRLDECRTHAPTHAHAAAAAAPLRQATTKLSLILKNNYCSQRPSQHAVVVDDDENRVLFTFREVLWLTNCEKCSGVVGRQAAGPTFAHNTWRFFAVFM